MKFSDNSPTLKKYKIPWHFPDAYEPWYYAINMLIYFLKCINNLLFISEKHCEQLNQSQMEIPQCPVDDDVMFKVSWN